MSTATSIPRITPALMAQLGLAADTSPAAAELYLRYVRALAVLAECAPYVDEPDYMALIGDVLADAQAHYPLVVCRNSDRWEIAPKVDC